MEQKGALVPIGELTVYLDGLTVTDQEELAPLTNGNTANGTSELSIYMLGVGNGGAAIFNYYKEGQGGKTLQKYTLHTKHATKYTLVHNICRLILFFLILSRSPTEWRCHP